MIKLNREKNRIFFKNSKPDYYKDIIRITYIFGISVYTYTEKKEKGGEKYMNYNNNDFNDLNDPVSIELKKKLKGRQQQLTAEEMKKGGNILGGKVTEIIGKLNERSADSNLKKISEVKSDILQQTNKVS